MNQETIKQKLHEWLTTFVEVPNPKLGGFSPCPFARKARIDNQIAIEFIDSPCHYRETYQTLLNDFEVVIYCFDHNSISGKDLAEWVVDENEKITKSNFVILEDHPDTHEEINEVTMNFGHCALLIVQELNRLNTASKQLKEKGYYDHWSNDNLDDIVNWRFDGT